MKDVVITGYLRTAQSRSRPNDPARDYFHKMRSDELLALLLKALVDKTGIEAKEIDDLLVASAIGAGEQWTFGGRYPLFLANFPETVPAKFVDQQCGSSMAAIHVGFMEIATGNADIVMVGGMEHLTRIPMTQATFDKGLVAPNMALMTASEYKHWDMAVTANMGLTAEKLLSLTDYTREDLDQWALRSHQLAAQAQNDGFFDDEILPVEAEQHDGTVITAVKDQAVRSDTTMEDMAGLKPAFKKDGAITAGNSSPFNAGASSMILMSKETAEAKGIKPLATIRSIGFAGVDPTIMGSGPVPASIKALEKAGLQSDQIDFWEINEAFCIVTLYCIKELGIDPDKVNVMGGATAIGHPLGATGARIVGTLARILNSKEGRYGCATACCGGGQGVATIIEKEVD